MKGLEQSAWAVSEGLKEHCEKLKTRIFSKLSLVHVGLKEPCNFSLSLEDFKVSQNLLAKGMLQLLKLQSLQDF